MIFSVSSIKSRGMRWVEQAVCMGITISRYEI